MQDQAPKILEGEKAILDWLASFGLKRQGSWLRKWRKQKRKPALPVSTMRGSNRLVAHPNKLARWVRSLLAGSQ